MSFFSSIWGSIWSSGAALGDTASALVAFFQTITDYTMWRSLGWLILGIIMIALGVYSWSKETVTPYVAAAAKAVK